MGNRVGKVGSGARLRPPGTLDKPGGFARAKSVLKISRLQKTLLKILFTVTGWTNDLQNTLLQTALL